MYLVGRAFYRDGILTEQSGDLLDIDRYTSMVKLYQCWGTYQGPDGKTLKCEYEKLRPEDSECPVCRSTFDNLEDEAKLHPPPKTDPVALPNPKQKALPPAPQD